MDKERFEELAKIAQNPEHLKEIQDAIDKIIQTHYQIIEDWCKAYMAEMYEAGHEIRPGMFVLNQQYTKDGYKYWFSLKGEDEN